MALISEIIDKLCINYCEKSRTSAMAIWAQELKWKPIYWGPSIKRSLHVV